MTKKQKAEKGPPIDKNRKNTSLRQICKENDMVIVK